MANTSAPLAVAVDPDPLVLERVVTARRLGTYKLKDNFAYAYGNGEDGNGHSNGENGHGTNGHTKGENGQNGGNGQNGENGQNGGNGYSSNTGASQVLPSSTGTGLAAFGLGFLSAGRKPAPATPIFSDNPWGDDPAPAPEPPATAASTPNNSVPNNAAPSMPASMFSGLNLPVQDPTQLGSGTEADFSIGLDTPQPPIFPSTFAPIEPQSPFEPTDPMSPGAMPAATTQPQYNAQQQADLGSSQAAPEDQSTSPWDKPASPTPFDSVDPFSSGAETAQNMFMTQPAQGAVAEDTGRAIQSQTGEHSLMQATPDAPPLDPFSFDTASANNQVSNSFFDAPAASPNLITPEETFPVSAPVSADREAVAPQRIGDEISGDSFPVSTASAATNSSDSANAIVEAEQVIDVEAKDKSNFAQTAAIAAAAAVAGAAAGAIAANAMNKSNAGSGDFFDMGPDAMRNGRITPGATIKAEEPAFDPFAPTAGAPASSSNSGSNTASSSSSIMSGGDDFFSAAPPVRTKRDDGVVEELKENSASNSSGSKIDGAAFKNNSDDSLEDEISKRSSLRDSLTNSQTEPGMRPKIARPRGFAPGKDKENKDAVKLTEAPDTSEDFFTGKKKEAAKNTDIEDDDSDEEKEDPPPRKSFSGGASTIKRPGAKKKEVIKEKSKGKNKDEDSSHDSDDDDDDANVPFFEKEVHIGSMSLTRKSAVIVGTICAFMTVVVFNTFLTLCTYLAGSLPQTASKGGSIFGQATAQKAVDLAGIYRIEYRTPRTNGKWIQWQLNLNQSGESLFARGEDRDGPWGMQGKIIPPNTIQFEKYYIKNGKASGKPVVYAGRFGSNELGFNSMGGQLQYEKKEGKFWRAQMVSITGQWRAQQTASRAVMEGIGGQQPSQIASNNPNGGSVSTLNNHPGPPGVNQNLLEFLTPKGEGTKPSNMSEKFLQIAFGLLGIGVLIALVALSIFGPSGKLNILAKQEYIPSQYRSQHNKMMNEWSKATKKGALPLGTRTEWRFWKPWTPRVLCMPPEARTNNPHMIIMGGSDKGKTRMMANMICSDISNNDRAVIVIDSDGELSDLVTQWAASHAQGKEFAKRIVIIDPTHKGGSMSYNPLEPLEDVNFIDAASAIVHGFKAIYTEPPGSQSQWNQQTANILRNAAILLMANNKTLTDLPTLLQDNDFRDILLEGVEKRKKDRTEYSTLIETWGQYKRLARTDQWINWVEPILNRVTPMLSDPRIRPILTKPVGDLRLHDLIINKQVLLVRIPQGQLDQNGNLLGSLLVTGIKQAALSLSNYKSDKHKPCSLYLDEMNNFIEKETIEALTQETDKFKIGFVGCCKTLQHLPEDFRNQIIINVGTVCAFALAKKDGDMIGPQMFRVDGRKVKHQTIQNFFNQVNTSPQFELISDEEKLNIDRVVGQEQRTFFCYRVGTVAGTFSLKTHDFPDPPKAKINAKLIDQMHRGVGIEKKAVESAS